MVCFSHLILGLLALLFHRIVLYISIIKKRKKIKRGEKKIQLKIMQVFSLYLHCFFRISFATVCICETILGTVSFGLHLAPANCRKTPKEV